MITIAPTIAACQRWLVQWLVHKRLDLPRMCIDDLVVAALVARIVKP
jgi:hypothetical protein